MFFFVRPHYPPTLTHLYPTLPRPTRPRYLAQLRLALEETRSGTHALCGAKRGVEADLRELQASVQRSSALLLTRAHDQQRDAATTHAEAADLVLRLHDAEVMVQNAHTRTPSHARATPCCLPPARKHAFPLVVGALAPPCDSFASFFLCVLFFVSNHPLCVSCQGKAAHANALVAAAQADAADARAEAHAADADAQHSRQRAHAAERDALAAQALVKKIPIYF